MSQSNNYISISPYTGEFFNEIPLWGRDKISHELDKSKKAFEAWKNTTVDDRKSFLTKLATYLLDHKELIAKTITDEMGKPITQSLAEVEKSALLCEYYYEKIETLNEPRKINLDSDTAFSMSVAVMPTF